AVLLTVTGLITLALYWVSYYGFQHWASEKLTFIEWMTKLGSNSWNPGQQPIASGDDSLRYISWLWSPRTEDLLRHFSSLCFAVTGRQLGHVQYAPHIAMGLGWVFLLLFAGYLLKGSRPASRLWFG